MSIVVNIKYRYNFGTKQSKTHCDLNNPVKIGYTYTDVLIKKSSERGYQHAIR